MSDYVDKAARQFAAERANGICEYCLVAEEDGYFRFHIDHIVSLKHGGASVTENLALACAFCNSYKGIDIATLSPITNELIRFYNPRVDRWNRHFGLNDELIIPKTEIGEATVRILQMNHDDRILERLVLKRVGRYPSESALHLITEH